MFKRSRAVMGLAVDCALTAALLDARGTVLDTVALADADITKTTLFDTAVWQPLLTLGRRCEWHIAMRDTYLSQQSFAINNARASAIQHLLSQKIKNDQAYDYVCSNQQCYVWQLAKTQLHALQLLAKRCQAKLTVVEPLSLAQTRLFATNFAEPYAVFFQHQTPVLHIVDHETVVFSHETTSNNIAHAINLYETCHEKSVTGLISNQNCDTTLNKQQMDLSNLPVDTQYLSAYATAKRGVYAFN